MNRYVAASLIVAALAMFIYVGRILVTGLATGVLSIRKGIWHREQEPAAYWYNTAVMTVSLLVPLLIAALAAFTIVG